jgi:hypothetical protein
MSPVERLKDLLFKPEDRAHCRSRWAQLTRGEVLFRTLSEVVQGRLPGDWDRLLSSVQSWESFPVSPDDEHQWDLVRRLVWSAAEAARRRDYYQSEIDRICFKLSLVPRFVVDDQHRIWGWIQTLLGTGTRGTSLTIPVALWVEEQKTGCLADLELEVLEAGAGVIFHHPRDAFSTDLQDGFIASMADAWNAAYELASRQGADVLRRGGRYRLTRDGNPLPEVRGRSAGGAAARGWWHALHGKIPDQGVIVLTDVGSSGELTGVRGVTEKVQAIMAAKRCFNTIVVADPDNRRQAEVALQGVGGIRVKDVSGRDT